MKKILALLFALFVSPAAAQTIPSGSWGSINYWGVGGLSQVLSPGLAGQCLYTQGVGSAPIWAACAVGSMSNLPSINTNQFYGNVSGSFAPPVGVDVNTILNTVGYDIARPPAVESILYKSNVGPAFNWQTLPPGTTGSLLTSGGPTNPPFWAANAIQANLSGVCTTVGAVLYFDTPSLQWKCLNPGTSGQLLQTGGAAGNPSWLTVTLATLGGVPSTRNINTSAPLTGGGDLSADRTLACPTCATTTNGGALSATAPETISAAGVIACPTCATTTNGGALSATAPETISAAGVIACPTCATTTNGGALSATAPVTISAAGVVACATCSTTSGAWSNTRLAKTAAYTVLTGDSGDTLALGGSAFFPLTFNAPSGYPATAAFMVTNEDTSFGKLIVPQFATSATSFTIGAGSKAFTTASGLPITAYVAASSARRYRIYSLANPANFMSGTVTSYVTTTLTINVDTVGGSGTFTDWQIAPEIRLWPGQSRMIYNQNNVWIIDDATRWKLSAETEICADASAGSDSNDGLGVGTRCFKTIQFATNVIYQDWDANNFPPDIGIYASPTEAVAMQGQITGYNFIRYRTRAANTWTSTSACITVSDNAEAILDATFGFTQTWTCNTSNTANTGAIFGHQLMVFDVSGAHNWKSGGTNDSFMFLDGEGRATISGSGAGIILGAAGASSGFAYVTCNYHCAGVTTGGTVSWGGTIALAAFYVAKAGSVIDHSANPTGTPGTIGVALSLGNSAIRLNGLTPPGGTPTAVFQGVCATTC